MGTCDRLDELVLLGVKTGSLPARLQRLEVELMALLEASARHAGRRLDPLYGLGRVRDEERSVGVAEESGRLDRLDLEVFDARGALADVDEGRDLRVARPQGPGNH